MAAFQESFKDRLKHAWNAFSSKETTSPYPSSGIYDQTSSISYVGGSTYRMDRHRLHYTSERSIVSSIYNRISIDVSSIPIKHARIDQNGRYKETIQSGLQECLSIEANVDQTGRELILDATLSMLDEGCVAIVPVETKSNIIKNNSFDILELRTGRITNWYPESVTVEVYNERVGKKQQITLPKRTVAIVENPFYSVMNEPNSTLKRLVHKLALLDNMDDKNSSSKLDLLIKLPYTVRSEASKKRAAERKTAIENQLVNDPYGIAYIDATEGVTQLNRPIENKLLNQINDLTSTLYSQLGVTKEVFDGTADEQTMLNYYNSTIEPILDAIVDEMKRKFLTKTARSQGQSIVYIRDPFKLVPVSQVAEISDKFTRNEIATSNEIRSIIGWVPSDDPKADKLINSNLNQPSETEYIDEEVVEDEDSGDSIGDIKYKEVFS